MDLHPDLADLSMFIGAWKGAGHGDYPTIEPFDYTEEVTIEPLGPKPVLVYVQRTRDAATGAPLHAETGYLRWPGAGRAEMVIAQPTGITEILAGTLEGGHMHLRALSVECTPTATEVTDTERHFEVEGDVLRYRLSMAAVGHPLGVHLQATLHRV
jgi:hypothetical protein